MTIVTNKKIIADEPFISKNVFNIGVATYRQELLRRAGGVDRVQVLDAVDYNHPLIEMHRDIFRSDRGIKTLQDMYSERMLSIQDLQNKVVLDMATGNGSFPAELRLHGVFSYGLDIALTEEQTQSLHADSRRTTRIVLPTSCETNVYILADAIDTHIADEQVDYIYDNFGIMFYYRENSQYVTAVLKEWCRILKIGGSIRYGSLLVNPLSEKDLPPGLSLTYSDTLKGTYELTRIQ